MYPTVSSRSPRAGASRTGRGPWPRTVPDVTRGSTAYRRRWALCAVVAAGLALAGCTGVTTTPGTSATTETMRDARDVAGPVTAIRLATTAGGVTVRGSARATTTTVRRVVHYRSGAPRPGRTYDSTGGTLTLRGCGRECSVDYTVEAPAGVPVTGSGEAGGILLSRVGRVGVRTEAGAVEVDSATGPVTAGTGAGAIVGRNLAYGPISARTENGAIDLDVTKPSDVRAETDNGGVEVTVPSAAYRVSAEVNGVGSRTIGVRNDPSAAHGLNLSTDNGAIAVRSG